MKIGFIGLGIMGTPMALHLLAAGHQLFVHTRSPLPEGVASSAAVGCADAARVARVFSDAAEQRLSVPVIARKDMSAAPVGAVTAK